VPIGKANVARTGKDITFVTIGACLHPALAAAKSLEADGVSAEVVDLLTVSPLDKDTILNSVAKTGRAVIVDTAHRTCSAGSDIAAIIVESAFDSLKGPVLRVTAPDVNVPFSPALERGMFPTDKAVLAAAKKLL